jgi:8-oxo-dGTP pyrophosphatase MutT (NUDIX family)
MVQVEGATPIDLCTIRRVSVPIREASSVILLREAAGGAGFEVFLVRRRKGASFMASAFVFPGGAAEPGEDARTAAVRELFEEAGVLLARFAPVVDRAASTTLEMPSLGGLRQRILAGDSAEEALAALSLAWASDALVPWSHWITPSLESKRFSARFFVCELPAGQEPMFDGDETVDQAWVTPAEAIARAKELMLPPPQVRTCWELAEHATIEAVLAAGRARADEPHPILPRLAAGAELGTPCLLLPWDPAYVERGSGDAAPLAYRPRWATGPSRFVMEDGAWKHIAP